MEGGREEKRKDTPLLVRAPKGFTSREAKLAPPKVFHVGNLDQCLLVHRLKITIQNKSSPWK
jgi:hypothetical protein